MLLCYIDESGTPEITGNTSHYVLAGLAIPVHKWKEAELDINKVKQKYGLEHNEIHTAWLLRKYIEQSKIPDFESLPKDQRIYEVQKYRKTELLRLQKGNNNKSYIQTKKTINLRKIISICLLMKEKCLLLNWRRLFQGGILPDYLPNVSTR